MDDTVYSRWGSKLSMHVVVEERREWTLGWEQDS